MRFVFWFVMLGLSTCAFSQQDNSPSTSAPLPEATQSSPADSPPTPETPPVKQADTPTAVTPSGDSSTPQGVPPSKQQPKRILGIMPNFRAVSAGALPPPPTPKQSFKIATQNSFDYSSFIFVGITSALAEGTNAHPDLGKGMGGFGQYYWRGLVDKTDGNYWVIFILPTIFHQDERYFAKGEGAVARLESAVSAAPDAEGRIARLERAGSVRAARKPPALELMSKEAPRLRPGASAVAAILDERREGR